ncbi:ABC transporter permease [Sphingomonas morindae]|uniref:ABC transporter permease n=1 Tax=Sphingomonas morindae TaxID=1541170 RepID=A0ABY4XDN7_9SPHN|nr:ABC transporter permease [Sphingomonas morindae]USI75043.1 ABC transporter permease [Sphingomonas morindae]
MDRLALTGFLRALARHKLYAALNIGGLALGIAVFLVLGLYVRFETSFERWLPGASQIWLLETRAADDNGPEARQSTPMALWSAIARDLPDTLGTRIDANRAIVVRDGIGVNETLAQVDADFFKLFELPVLEGSTAAGLADPTAIVLTRKTAAKYFGTASPVGQSIRLVYDGVSHVHHVIAVVADLPRNTDLDDFGLFARRILTEDPADDRYRRDHEWNYGGPQTYVRFASEAAEQRFAAALPALLARHVASETPDDPTYHIKIVPRRLTSVHFDTPGSRLTVTTLGTVGLLTLLLAIVNYVNLASARAGLRAREVAMRKVLGASRAALLRHYLLEAVATAAIAALLGLALAEAGLPLVNAAGGLALVIHYGPSHGVLLPLAALVLLVGLLAGAYPALLLARFPAAAVLASARAPGGGRAGARVRELLVIFQFAVAIAFIVGTLVLVAQTRHVRAADLGFRRDNLLVVKSLSSSSLSDGQRDTLLHHFATLPGVRAVSAANTVPGHGFFTSSSNFPVPGLAGDGPSVDFFEVTPGYLETIGARLLAGRLFDTAHRGDFNPNAKNPKGTNGPLRTNVVLNRSAVAALHLGSPQAAIGKSFGGATPKTVIGVVEDLRFDSPRQVVAPTLYSAVERNPAMVIGVIRFSGDPQAMLAAAREAWLQDAPEVPFQAETANQALDKFYKRDVHTARLFTIGALLAVLIGCVGLWGLASFNTARRVKEIGIRKTLGASSADIVRLLIGQFLRPVLIANLFAWPLAWLAMHTWLAGFADRIALSPLFFVAATVLALVVALGTVAAQSLRAARATPAWALRHD